MTTKAQAAERAEAIADLLKLLKPGDTVYTRIDHVARSGMMRVIDLFIIRDNEPHCITWQVCKAVDRKYNRRHEGLEANGCGMDMCFDAVYRLGRALWPNGTDKPHGTRNGQPDMAGGYTLKQRSL